jgi:hypothetical protein
MHETKGLDGDSKKTQRVQLVMLAMMDCAVAAELIDTATPESRNISGF